MPSFSISAVFLNNHYNIWICTPERGNPIPMECYQQCWLSTHYPRIQLDICLFYSMIRSWTLFQISIWAALLNLFSRLFWPKFHLSFSQISQKPWGGWVGKQIWERFPKKKRVFFWQLPLCKQRLTLINPSVSGNLYLVKCQWIWFQKNEICLHPPWEIINFFEIIPIVKYSFRNLVRLCNSTPLLLLHNCFYSHLHDCFIHVAA